MLVIKFNTFLFVPTSRPAGAHPTSFPTDAGVSYPGDKADDAWSWPLTSR